MATARTSEDTRKSPARKAKPEMDAIQLLKADHRQVEEWFEEFEKAKADRKREILAAHARDIIARRLAPAQPAKDGKQTPYRGHPVFIAQHATGTCCRSCLEKWHHIPKGAELTQEQQDYVVDVIVSWIYRR